MAPTNVPDVSTTSSSTQVMDRDEVCRECGHAATEEAPMPLALFYGLLGMDPPAHCPAVWDDDYGLPADPCGCKEAVHAA